MIPIVISTCEDFLFKVHRYEQNVGRPLPDMLETKTTHNIYNSKNVTVLFVSKIIELDQLVNQY